MIASDTVASTAATISTQVLDAVTAATTTDAVSVCLSDTANNEVSVDVLSDAVASNADTVSARVSQALLDQVSAAIPSV